MVILRPAIKFNPVCSAKPVGNTDESDGPCSKKSILGRFRMKGITLLAQYFRLLDTLQTNGGQKEENYQTAVKKAATLLDVRINDSKLSSSRQKSSNTAACKDKGQ